MARFPRQGGSAREQPPARSAQTCDCSGQGQAALWDVQPGRSRMEPPTPAPTAALLTSCPQAPPGWQAPRPFLRAKPSGRKRSRRGLGGVAEQLSATGGCAMNMTLLGRGHACEIKDLKTNWVPDQQGGSSTRDTAQGATGGDGQE